MASHQSLDKKYWAKDMRQNGVEFHDLTSNPHEIVIHSKPLTDAQIREHLNVAHRIQDLIKGLQAYPKG